MTKKTTFPRWPSEFLANLCRPICLGGLTGRHWLAGNSEGHRGISKFLFLLVPYNYYGALATEIREVAFFYHLKSHSYIVATTGICMLSAHNDVTKCKTGAVVNVEIIYGQTLEQSEGKMLFFSIYKCTFYCTYLY